MIGTLLLRLLRGRRRVGDDAEELDAHVGADLEADAPAVQAKVHHHERLQREKETICWCETAVFRGHP